MNQLFASQIGLQLPALSARDAVMKPGQRTGQATNASPIILSRLDRHRDSLLCLADRVKLSSSSSLDDIIMSSKHGVAKDDDTASTVSSDESYSSCLGVSVTFAEPLVTEVRTRPVTTVAEKHLLFYSDVEYRQFRRDYFESKRRRGSLVQFSDEIVSSVHEYSSEGKKEDLFYNDSDLQRFLDEFVASLNESLSS